MLILLHMKIDSLSSLSDWVIFDSSTLVPVTHSEYSYGIPDLEFSLAQPWILQVFGEIDTRSLSLSPLLSSPLTLPFSNKFNNF